MSENNFFFLWFYILMYVSKNSVIFLVICCKELHTVTNYAIQTVTFSYCKFEHYLTHKVQIWRNNFDRLYMHLMWPVVLVGDHIFFMTCILVMEKLEIEEINVMNTYWWNRRLTSGKLMNQIIWIWHNTNENPNMILKVL